MILDCLYILVAVLLTILAYRNSIYGAFVFDDLLLVERLREVRHKRRGKFSDYWERSKGARGVLWATYRRDVLLHDLSPELGQQWGAKIPTGVAGWHQTNIAIHAANVALMYGILRWSFDPLASLAGASLFGLHPIMTNSVSYLAGRSSSFCALFYLAGILSALAGAWPLVPAFFFLGWKTKRHEIITMPFAAGLILWLA